MIQTQRLEAGWMGTSDDATLLADVAKATRLREGPAGVSAILRSVYRGGSRRLQDVARDVGLPLPVATAVRRELEKAGFLERKHGLSLTEKGLRFAESVLGLEVVLDVDCHACETRGIVIPQALHGAVERLAAIVHAAPSVDVTLDQAPCTPQTAILRALLMLRGGALEGQRILLLGDDDSVSLAILLVARALADSDFTRGVTVIDADPRRLAFIADAARLEGMHVQTELHDLRDPLPSGLRRSFDVVVTDPPYTLDGARLFLGRGTEAFAEADGGLCYFSFAEWPAQRLMALQQVFLDLGYVPKSILPRFNRYAGATVLGNEGRLFELVHVAPPKSELPRWEGPLYTAEQNERARIYECAGCGRKIELGSAGAPATIHELKDAGCSACEGRIFRRVAGG
jgi:N4-bis(aminopropyl)spermidine synthase